MSDMSVAQLLAFLKEGGPQTATIPPTPPALPAGAERLPTDILVATCVRYTREYGFNRKIYKYHPVKRKRSTRTPDAKWKLRAANYLCSCIVVDRVNLATLSSNPATYNASYEQRQFILNEFIPRRWMLEEMASEILALVEFVKYNTRAASAVTTPMHTGEPSNRTVVDQVRQRDVGCRMTGVKRSPASWTTEELDRWNRERPVIVPKLEVVHGLPHQMGETTYGLVKALTGIEFPVDEWNPDVPQNAFLAQPMVHSIFGEFRIWLDFTSNGQRVGRQFKQIFIRGRDGPGTPFPALSGVMNNCRQSCGRLNEFVDRELQPTHDPIIPDLDKKIFILHRFVGDVVWLSGGAEPTSDDEDGDEIEKVRLEDHFEDLDAKLRSPDMDLVPRLRDGMFGSELELVKFNKVWNDHYSAIDNS
ncbi:hypothetical protein GGX14DRAFT_388258 [Mycena pura]|uniref:Uncharacterized protein n=1 Tax=Mycena pura TaxID=153505 RepID=A0AAD6YL54_9AGAR|nr:hypothetical protein GGX14DRAFT_388258 [Mycena pura]